jgi:hypothetical protein
VPLPPGVGLPASMQAPKRVVPPKVFRILEERNGAEYGVSATALNKHQVVAPFWHVWIAH